MFDEILHGEVAIDYERLGQYQCIQSLLCDDRVTDIFEWMAYTLSVSDWQEEDGSTNEVGLAEHADRHYSATWATRQLCEGAAVLYGYWVHCEFSD